MKEKLMARAERSLRLVVERWLAPEFAKQVRVTRFRNRRSVRECYVCVETFNAAGAVAMFFFVTKTAHGGFFRRAGNGQ
jgi:hypothetical protein